VVTRAAVLAPLVAALLASSAPLRAEQPTFFVIDAIKNDNGEIAIGTLVRQQAASAEVRDLGAMLVRDHTASKAQAIAAGRAVGVGVPTEMTPRAKHLLRKLGRLSGGGFDTAFLTAAIKDYRKTVDKFAEQGRSGDAVTGKLAGDALPRLREHLRIALSLR
jgi:putative membrane protein